MRTYEERTEEATLRDFLEEIALVSEADQLSGESGRVALMTLHASKGLEFDYVFIIGLEENLLPHARSMAEGALEEERRLCYVGMTRAREGLTLSSATQRSLYGSTMLNGYSRFLGELPPDDLEIIGQDNRF
jgi:DNA helicase-2/ATP-dependent DNA helicase PcrA